MSERVSTKAFAAELERVADTINSASDEDRSRLLQRSAAMLRDLRDHLIGESFQGDAALESFVNELDSAARKSSNNSSADVATHLTSCGSQNPRFADRSEPR
ncbi:MAG TPA: hypothetical protein VGN97_22840 [Mesorhizobium sp.]|jgi:hypothetical protein|nr:hypothetical protein [Mesorhizobium sp.]